MKVYSLLTKCHAMKTCGGAEV